MSWCPADPDLLLSSGKDNRILCWNPNSEFKMGEVCMQIIILCALLSALYNKVDAVDGIIHFMVLMT
jgi:hypothetical protein